MVDAPQLHPHHQDHLQPQFSRKRREKLPITHRHPPATGPFHHQKIMRCGHCPAQISRQGIDGDPAASFRRRKVRGHGIGKHQRVHLCIRQLYRRSILQHHCIVIPQPVCGLFRSGSHRF